MGWLSGLLVYFMAWWVVLFIVLPFGAPRDYNPSVLDSEPEEVLESKEISFKKKLLITSIISLVVTVIIYVLVEIQLVDFRSISVEMIKRG